MGRLQIVCGQGRQRCLPPELQRDGIIPGPLSAQGSAVREVSTVAGNVGVVLLHARAPWVMCPDAG